MTTPPNQTLQRTRRERRGCNRCVPCAGSLSLGLGVMRAFWFIYGPLATHLLVAIIVWFRRRRRGGSWSILDTAACLVGPFALVLCWAIALGFGVQFAFP